MSNYFEGSPAGFPTSIQAQRRGRYVRVQLSGTNYLHIGDLQIMGASTFVNAAPTIDPVSDPDIIPSDLGQQQINLTGITDGNAGMSDVTITASSSNTSVIPDPTIIYTAGENTAILQYTPAGDIGIAVITLTLTDETELTMVGQTKQACRLMLKSPVRILTIHLL